MWNTNYASAILLSDGHFLGSCAKRQLAWAVPNQGQLPKCKVEHAFPPLPTAPRISIGSTRPAIATTLPLALRMLARTRA
jgi:hypothetical protein